MKKHENSHLQNAWNLYGESVFKVIVVDEFPPINLILEEQKYLDIAKSEKDKCYNQNFVAGCGPGHKRRTTFSKSHVENLKIAHQGQIPWNRGLTKENNLSVKKMSTSKIGVPNSKISKSYTFVGPTMEVVKIHNLKEYCRTHHLTYTTMVKIARGGRYKNHKGWMRYV